MVICSPALHIIHKTHGREARISSVLRVWSVFESSWSLMQLQQHDPKAFPKSLKLTNRSSSMSVNTTAVRSQSSPKRLLFHLLLCPFPLLLKPPEFVSHHALPNCQPLIAKCGQHSACCSLLGIARNFSQKLEKVFVIRSNAVVVFAPFLGSRSLCFPALLVSNWW